MKTKPFNLEQALSGKPVVYRCGRPCLEVVILKTLPPNGYQRIFAAYSGGYTTHSDDGSYYGNDSGESGNDLLMLCEEKEYWIATGKSHLNDIIYKSDLFDNEQMAAGSLRASIHLIEETLQTHKIIRYE